MAEKKKFGTRFKSRPVKSNGLRRQRVKTHRRRLVAAGWDETKVSKMDAKALREAIKTIKNVN